MNLLTAFPKVNPIAYTQRGLDMGVGHYSKLYLDFPFRFAGPRFTQGKDFKSVWSTEDPLVQQCLCNNDIPTMTLYNCYGAPVIASHPWTQVMESDDEPGLFVYEDTMDLSGLSHGVYYPVVTSGTAGNFYVFDGEPILVTNRVSILQHTIKVEYSSDESHGGAFFETGIGFILRLFGVLSYKSPGSKNVVYEDQPLNQTLVQSRPYAVLEFNISGLNGVPEWFIEMFNEIFGCRTVKIGGRQYCIATENASWEETKTPGVAKAGYKIDLREVSNKHRREFSNAWVTGPIMAAATMDGRGFVTGDDADKLINTII